MTTNDIGMVGSPSTTAKVTVDILEDATGFPLRGQLVSLTHRMDNQYLIALGTVTEIRTSNRWHEDPNMRGVLKRHGSLPHLSAVGDVRTADVAVQAVYLAEHENPSDGEPPRESGGSLAMSPTTGALKLDELQTRSCLTSFVGIVKRSFTLGTLMAWRMSSFP